MGSKDKFHQKSFNVGMTDATEQSDYYIRWQVAFKNEKLCSFCRYYKTDYCLSSKGTIKKTTEDKNGRVIECNRFKKIVNQLNS